MKKLFVGAVTIAMVLGFGTNALYAAEDVKDVDVTYDNSESITDPDDPDGNWGVRVPSAIQFSDTNLTVDVTVELVGMNGTIINTIDKQVDVSVKSKNGMVLLLDGLANNDPVDYEVKYLNEGPVTGSTPLVFELDSKGKVKEEGTATKTGLATKKGNHIDVLTYSVALK